MKLAEFIARVERYDFASQKQLIAEDLEQLARNRSLLSDYLQGRLLGTVPVKGSDLYNAYAFTLYECDRFMIRLVMWAPVESQDEAETFIYGLVHSHDFELFVTGYCGDGYETILRPIVGDLNLKAGVMPAFGEASRLKVAPGTSYYMQPFRDVHLQLPPQTLSGSLSLVAYLPGHHDDQKAWCFDDDYFPRHAGYGAAEQALYAEGMSTLEGWLKKGTDSASALSHSDSNVR